MRLHFHRDSHNTRHVDLVAVIALLVAVYGGVCYLASPGFAPVSTASYIEASQSSRW